MNKQPWPYEDIVHRRRPISKSHSPIPEDVRAAQFLSFDTLAGFEDAVEETGRWTDRRIELEENERVMLRELLCLLDEMHEIHPRVTVTYFVPDSKKEGGMYLTVTGVFKALDDASHCMLLRSGRAIPLDDILALNCEQIRVSDPSEKLHHS